MPITLNETYFEIYGYRLILSTLSVLLAIIAIHSVLTIAKKCQIDGSQLIILSKPISKVKIIWCKVFTLVFVNTLISIFSLLISVFTLIDNNISEMRGIILGSFLAPWIILMFWCGISFIGCIFFSYYSLFFITLGIASILAIFGNTIYVAADKPSQLVQKTNIKNTPITLVNNNKELLQCELATYGGSGINENTIINNKTIEENGYNLNTLLPNIYENALKQSKLIPISYLNLENLLIGINNLPISNWSIPKYRDVYHSFFNANISFYLKFAPINNLDELLNQNVKIELNDQNIYLVANSTFSSNNIINFQNVTLPVFNLNNQTKNFMVQEFNSSNLAEFASSYYSNEVINKIIAMQNYLNKYDVNNNQVSNGYLSLLASYWYTAENTNFQKINKSWEFFLKFKNSLAKFQYYTFLFMQDYLNNENKYNNLQVDKEDLLGICFNVLNQRYKQKLSSLNLQPTNRQFIVVSAEQCHTLVNNPESFNHNLISNQSIRSQIIFTLMTGDNLQTLSSVKIVPIYNYVIAIPILFIVILLLNFTGASLMLKKDQF